MHLEPHDYRIYYVNIVLRHQYGISVAELQTFLLAGYTEGSWQGSFKVNNERPVRTLKPSSEQKNALRQFLQGQNFLVNLPTGLPASSNRCRCTAVFCNLADSSSVKTNHVAMIFTSPPRTPLPPPQKKNYAHVSSFLGPGISKKIKENKIRLFSRNKSS